MQLRGTLPDARFVGCDDLWVFGCSIDSRHTQPGEVFIALDDRIEDRRRQVLRALDRGASGVIIEGDCPEAGHPRVIVPDVRLALSRIAHALFGSPSESLPLIGVTGISGTATTAAMLRSIFEAQGLRCGLISSNVWFDGQRAHPIGSTPPHAMAAAEMLSVMVDLGCDIGIVEVSESCLNRRTYDAARFRAAVATRFEPDDENQADLDLDLDLDPSTPRHPAARLFRGIEPGGFSVVLADDRRADLLGAVNLQSRLVRYSCRGTADFNASIRSMDRLGTTLRLDSLVSLPELRIRPLGRRNAEAAIAAAALAQAMEIEPTLILDGLRSTAPVPGSLEPVLSRSARDLALDLDPGMDVRLDHARTPRALRDALSNLRDSGAARIFCVLGAEGRGSSLERARLGRVAELGADRVVLTTDSPRNEDPDRVLDDLLSGMAAPGRVRIVPDRREAIETTLDLVSPGDAVLIAGRGPARYQIFADRVQSFDDAEIVRSWARRRVRPEPQHRRSA